MQGYKYTIRKSFDELSARRLGTNIDDISYPVNYNPSLSFELYTYYPRSSMFVCISYIYAHYFFHCKGLRVTDL